MMGGDDMATAQDFIKVARAQVGYKESPPNSNKTKFGAWYGLDANPWCDMFVSWCADQCGALGVVGKFAYTPAHANFFKTRGQWLDREEKPQPGDIVFFSNKTRICHVGIVTARNGTVSVDTIEGNTSLTSNDNGGAVMARTRTYGAKGSNWYIAGFGRPQWSTPAPTPTPTPTPSGKIAVDGEWGKATTRALQSYLGTPVDGIVSGQRTAYKKHWPACLSSSWQWGRSGSSQMIKALQRLLGVGADGIAGPATCKALQRRLGVAQDGICGPNTVKALQKALNNGKL